MITIKNCECLSSRLTRLAQRYNYLSRCGVGIDMTPAEERVLVSALEADMADPLLKDPAVLRRHPHGALKDRMALVRKMEEAAAEVRLATLCRLGY